MAGDGRDHGRRAGSCVEFEDRCCHTPGAKSAFLRTFDLALGDFHVAGVFAVVGETVETPTGFELSSDSVRLLRAFAKPAAQWEPAILGSLLKVCSDELEAGVGLLARCHAEGAGLDTREDSRLFEKLTADSLLEMEPEP